jgi:hypothetical protein
MSREYAMKRLSQTLNVILPTFLAGYAAWCFIPCQPERSYPVPNETKLLEFSPAGNYVVTFQRENRRLSLWRADTGNEAYAAEIPCVLASNESTSGIRGFYGLSSNDRWLAIPIGLPDESNLVIVDLESGNELTRASGPPPDPRRYRPQPIFSSDGRYLCYFSQTADTKDCGVLYDIAGRHEQFRVPGAFSSLGPPTREGKWFFHGKKGIECWDVVQKEFDDRFPLWTHDYSMMSTSLSPDEQTIRALCIAEKPRFSKERIFLNCWDCATRKMETAWEYTFPPSAYLFWNVASSDPETYLLIKTLDDQGNLVQDLLDVNSGKVLMRYPQPISMLEEVSYSGDRTLPPSMGAGLIHTLGRTGEIGIDSERRVLVSKQVNRDPILWRHFGNQLRWLGLRQGPPALFLQFHSAETGKLLERVSLHTPYRAFTCTLAVHPSQPLLAVIDEQVTGPRLQFWHLPPPKPWGWIIFCSLAVAVCTTLLRFGIRNLIRRRRPPVEAR